VLFDLGDFVDDYAVDRQLRNDLGLLWFVELDGAAPRTIQALPLALDYCFTRAASAQESDWILRRLRALCAPFGTEVGFSDGLIDVRPRS
jgi:poly-gamma-glutamate synthesis protein (capsule biosynthesis protein)